MREFGNMLPYGNEIKQLRGLIQNQPMTCWLAVYLNGSHRLTKTRLLTSSSKTKNQNNSEKECGVHMYKLILKFKIRVVKLKLQKTKCTHNVKCGCGKPDTHSVFVLSYLVIIFII